MSAPMDPVVAAGFTVVPIKFSEKTTTGHYLYVKEHSTRGSDACKPSDRTLFVLNVPPYVTEACLERIFSDCGKVENVFLHKKPTASAPPSEDSRYFPAVQTITGFKVAYIVFKKAASIHKAKKIPYGEARILSTKDHPLITGIRKWSKEYKDSDVQLKELESEIEEYMTGYDSKVEEVKQKAKDSEGVPDDDGWVTVTRHGKNKGIPRTEAQAKKITAKEKRRRKDKELLNFYTFQLRESKREHLAQLRQKFEEDKQRIAMMKTQRRFKPY